MKELETPTISPDKEKLEITIQQQQEKKLIYVGQTMLRRGHKCFEINTETAEIKEAEYMRKDITLNDAMDETYLSRSIMKKPKCVYINALNKKNALKKYDHGRM